MVLAGLILSLEVFADCSPYEGLVTINEVNKERANGNDNSQDFVEVKLLDTSIPDSQYLTWSIEICENTNQGCRAFGLSEFDDSTFPWLVLKGGSANTYYDFSTGFNIILRDGEGDSIDYLDFDPSSGDTFQPLEDSSCSFTFDTKASQNSAGQSVKRIRRRPDGTGNWDSVTPQSTDDSEGGTNDEVAPNAPELSIDSPTVFAGEDLIFTLTLSGVVASDLTVAIRTRDGTAIAGEDYTSVAQADLVIPAGSQSLTVAVPTEAGSEGGTLYLEVSGTGADDPVITNQLALGTIEAASLAGFDINVGGGNASTCAPQAIALAAVDSSGALIENYDGVVNLSTSTGNGNWLVSVGGMSSSDPAQGVLAPGSDDSGSANYGFSAADNGTVTLFLDNTHAETLVISVVDGDQGVTSSSASLTFRENAFVIGNIDSLGDDVVAGRSHEFEVSVVRQDPVSGDCALASRYNRSAVKVWLSRSESDPGGAPPSLVTGTGVAQLPSSEPTVDNLTFPFVSGRAQFSLETSDVGHYVLEFRDDSGDFSDVPLVGASSTLTVRPFAFDVDAVGNPAATDSLGPVFGVAGDLFSVQVRAVGWSSQDDTNDDGIADGHDDDNPGNNADLSDNPLLPGFGQEVAAEQLELSARLISPLGGADPGLSDADPSPVDGRVLTQFSNGQALTSNVRYDEVGIVELAVAVRDDNYLSAGVARTAKAVGRSGYVGRFIPSSFRLSNPLITPFCSSGTPFSYMEQTFEVSVRLTAINRLGDPTTNYRDGFIKLDYRDQDGDGTRERFGDVLFGAIDSVAAEQTDRIVPPQGFAGFVEATEFSWTGGAGDLDTLLIFERDGEPDGPFHQVTLGFLAEDADGVLATPLDLDTDTDGTDDYLELADTALRYGRLRIEDAFGPEVIDLPVPFYTEYWNGSEFVRNVDDSCTRIPRDAITYQPTGDLVDDSNRTVPIGGGSTTGQYANLDGVGVNFSSSDADHYFTAPGQGNTGSFDIGIDLTNRPWLRFDWNQDGDFLNDIQMPPANVGFGSYRGHDRIIYWREVLE
mgnify:CR=1 FL=1